MYISVFRDWDDLAGKIQAIKDLKKVIMALDPKDSMPLIRAKRCLEEGTILDWLLRPQDFGAKEAQKVINLLHEAGFVVYCFVVLKA